MNPGLLAVGAWLVIVLAHALGVVWTEEAYMRDTTFRYIQPGFSTGPGTRVFLGRLDVTRQVRGFRLEARAGRVTELTLDLLPQRIEVDATVRRFSSGEER